MDSSSEAIYEVYIVLYLEAFKLDTSRRYLNLRNHAESHCVPDHRYLLSLVGNASDGDLSHITARPQINGRSGTLFCPFGSILAMDEACISSQC
jgi:hypothetical protein